MPAVFTAGAGVQVFVPAHLLAQEDGVEEPAATTEEVAEEEDPPNPILPVWSEVFWNVGAFLVLVVVMKYVAYPAVKRGIEARDARIKADIDAAAASKAEADHVLADYQARMAQARAEANVIIEEARAAVEQARSEQLAALNAELATLRAQAGDDIAAAKAQALRELQGSVADLAVGAAERVVGRNLDRQRELVAIEDYLRRAADGSTR